MIMIKEVSRGMRVGELQGLYFSERKPVDDPHDDVVHWLQFIRESERKTKDDWTY